MSSDKRKVIAYLVNTVLEEADICLGTSRVTEEPGLQELSFRLASCKKESYCKIWRQVSVFTIVHRIA